MVARRLRPEGPIKGDDDEINALLSNVGNIELRHKDLLSMLDQRKIKILMLQRGVNTQRELAERLSTREWTLSKTIRGHRKNPWLVKKLARFFRVDPDRLKAA